MQTKKIILSWILYTLFLNVLSAQHLKRVAPPHWYVNMNSPSLQLMLYGDNIAQYDISIKGKGLELLKVNKVENANYLFLDLQIKNSAKAKNYEIQLKQNNQIVERYPYELRSRNIDPDNVKSFSAKDVIYLITPDRFANGDPQNDSVEGMKESHARDLEYGRHGGDLQGIIDHLDYIEEMGFTALWINPVMENDQDDWSYHGYATTDYYKVDPRFGSNELYKELIDQAKQRGIGVIQDMIANHCGHQHWWMDDLPSKDWINRFDTSYQQTNHRKFSVLDPYVAPEDRDIMVRGWFVPTMPDLNQNNPFLAKYLIQNSIWWIEFASLYGIRQDTYSYPFKSFMTDWTCAIMEEYPDFNIVGEEWVDDPSLIAYWLENKNNPDGYSSCLKSNMDFPMNFIIAKAINEKEEWGKGLVRLYEHIARDYHYPDPNNLVTMADNHDMSRIAEQLDGDLEENKMVMAYLLTMRGIPQVYYGCEILMDHPNSDSHGVIRSDFPGGWSGDIKNGFTGSGLSEDELEFQAYLRAVLNWRKDAQVIHNGKLMHYEPRDKVYVYFRYNEDDVVMVVINKNEDSYTLNLDRFKRFLSDATHLKDVLDQTKHSVNAKLTLDRKGAYIFEVNK